MDDLCLISTNAKEVQDMIHVCQMWSEKARMKMNADKLKIMAFHETAQQKNARKKPTKKGDQNIHPAPFHLLSSYPNKQSEQQQYSDGRTLSSLASKGVKYTKLKEAKQFDYLGLRINLNLIMKAAGKAIKVKEIKGHALVSAVSYLL